MQGRPTESVLQGHELVVQQPLGHRDEDRRLERVLRIVGDSNSDAQLLGLAEDVSRGPGERKQVLTWTGLWTWSEAK